VIYTSGSTGKPKGVMIEHRSIANHACWMATRFGLTAADAILQKTSTSFDASVCEFSAPLVSGVRVVLAPPGTEADHETTVALCRRHAVTLVQFVPSIDRAYVHRGRGPAHRADRPPNRGGAGARARRRARARRSRRSGGTMGVGGIGVARGYLHLPELTAERFIADPFDPDPGARLYRTGDMVQWRADGELLFLGRTDEQVKLRGFRIELGEIETALLEQESVASALVMLRQDHGEPRLVAYVTGRGSQTPTPAQFRRLLAERLPDYMVPAA
jgi:non-ribosomal peptide synthetase component F